MASVSFYYVTFLLSLVSLAKGDQSDITMINMRNMPDNTTMSAQVNFNVTYIANKPDVSVALRIGYDDSSSGSIPEDVWSEFCVSSLCLCHGLTDSHRYQHLHSKYSAILPSNARYKMGQHTNNTLLL